MKIVDLKCPSCGGKLIPMEGNSKIVVCGYCNSQFILEEDQVVNYHIHQYGTNSMDNLPQATDKNTSTPVNPVLLVAFPFLIAGAIFAFSMAFNHAKAPETPTIPSISVPDGIYPAAGGDTKEEGEEQMAQGSGSLFYQAMVEAIFGKTADAVTPQELEELQYIRIEHLADYSEIAYSFDDPYGTKEPQIETIQVEKTTRDPKDLAAFTGLKKLGLGYEQPDGSVLKALKELRGLSGYKIQLSQLSELVDPGQIIELELEKTETLEGIGAFENLEILTLDHTGSLDLKQLVPLKHLRSLSIEEPYDAAEGDTWTDYTALSVLTSLESLHLDSPAIRELGFLKPLTNLTQLSIEGTEAIGIEPLAELVQLTSLTLADNDQVQDYSPISRLTGLESLTLDKGTSQDDPDLSALTGLQRLDIQGFISIAFLRNMTGLKSLSLHGCNIDEVGALSSLTSLEDLSMYSVWTYAVPLKGLSFVDGMSSLKVLDLGGDTSDSWGSFGYNVEIFGDISNVFNHPGLEALNLNNCIFGIDFDRIGENPSLKKLELKEIALKENFYVQTSGGMTDIWYDDVSFDAHKDFLTKFPNLEELYLDGNQITDIQFTASLKQLTHLGINDNYVTDLSPLNQAEHLRYLDVRKNPVSNTIEKGDKVVILQ